MSSPTIKASGNIAIVWGTANSVTGNNANVLPSGMIVETLTVTPKNADPIDIEGGAGFSAILVGLKDGFNGKAGGVYDSNKIMPAEGDNITLVIPKSDGANSGTTNVNCTFWSWGFTKARKKEQLIDLNFTYRPDINT